jgi:hypothetical protein
MSTTGHVRTVACVASALSCFAIVSCILAVPSLIADIMAVRAELDNEMNGFHDMSKQLWTNLVALNALPRARRQAGYGQPPPSTGYGSPPAAIASTPVVQQPPQCRMFYTYRYLFHFLFQNVTPTTHAPKDRPARRAYRAPTA